MNTLRRTARTAAGIVLVLAVAVAVLTVLVPRLFGWVPLTVLTSSMEPTIPAGSQVVVDELTDADTIGIGDVVTFMPYPDSSTLVTHRVVGIGAGTSTTTFTTQGDANGAPDPWTLTPTQLRGVVQYHVPYAGHLATALDGNQKSIGITVAAAAMFGYAAYLVISAARHRRTSDEDVVLALEMASTGRVAHDTQPIEHAVLEEARA